MGYKCLKQLIFKTEFEDGEENEYLYACFEINFLVDPYLESNKIRNCEMGR